MRYELSHDSLAAKIEEMVSDEQKIRRKMMRFLEERYGHYQTREVLLNKDDLDYVRPYLGSLLLPEEVKGFVQKSESAVRQRRRVFLSVVAAVIVVISVLAIRAWMESRRYQAQYLNARARQILSADPTVALRTGEAAWDIDHSQVIREDMFDIYRHEVFYHTLLRTEAPVIDGVRESSGQVITVAKAQNEPRIWSDEGASLGVLSGHIHPVYDIALAGNGYRVTAGNDKTAILWDKSGKKLQVFRPENESQAPDIRSVDISSDAKWVITGASDGTISLWQAENHSPIFAAKVSGEVRDISLSDDGQAFIAATSSSPVQYFHKSEGGEFQKIEVKEAGPADAVGMSGDGKSVITADRNYVVTLWKVQGDSLARVHHLGKHSGAITRLTFSPDEQWVASSSGDSTARLWAASGEAKYVLRGHRAPVTSVSFSPDNILMTTSLDSTVRLWHMPSPSAWSKLEIHSQDALATAFSPDQQQIVSGGRDRKVCLTDVASRSLIMEHREHQEGVIAVGFMGEESLVSIDEYGELIQYDLASRSVSNKFSAGDNFLLCAAFSVGGNLLLTGGEDSTAVLWEVDGGKQLLSVAHPDIVTAVAISPDQQRILTGCGDGKAYLWSRNGELVKTFTGHQREVQAVAFTPKSQQILTGGWDNKIILHDRNGNHIRTFEEYAAAISSLDMNPEETLLVAGYKGNLAVLFDTEGFAIGDLPGHTGFVNTVKFSPEGNYIITASDDHNLRIWDDIKRPLSDFLKQGKLEKMDARMKQIYQID